MKKLTVFLMLMFAVSATAQNKKSSSEVREAVQKANAAAGHGTSKVGEQTNSNAAATSTNKSKGAMPAEGPQPTPAVPYGSQQFQANE